MILGHASQNDESSVSSTSSIPSLKKQKIQSLNDRYLNPDVFQNLSSKTENNIKATKRSTSKIYFFFQSIFF